MDWINTIFEKQDNLSCLQMSIRGVLVFLATLIVMRIGAKRTFGKETAVDYVVIILLGGILGRAVVGASPILPVIISTFFILLFHRFLAWICLRNHFMGNLIKGEKKQLFADGKPNKKNMDTALISNEDLLEGIRMMINARDTSNVKEIFIERNGEISVVKKEE